MQIANVNLGDIHSNQCRSYLARFGVLFIRYAPLFHQHSVHTNY